MSREGTLTWIILSSHHLTKVYMIFDHTRFWSTILLWSDKIIFGQKKNFRSIRVNNLPNDYFQVRMIKILLEHGADKKATVEDLYHPVDLLSHDRSKAKDFLKLSQFERKHCSSSGGSSDNESPTPPSSAFNHLDESSNYSTITPSPEGFPMYR